MSSSNIESLFQKYLQNQCTPMEAEQVLEWLEQASYSPEQKELISRMLGEVSVPTQKEEENVRNRLKQQLDLTLQKIDERENNSGQLIHFRWLRFAAAALLFLFAGAGVYLWIQSNITAQTGKQLAVVSNKDIAPGGNKAVLTLADGSKLILDETANGELATQGSTKLIKLDGQIAYAENGEQSDELYNTITTPIGGQYQLVLSDGTYVWLNSASSLRFPISFPGKERKVELMGEGYFEVAKNPSKPFKVSVQYPAGEKGTEVKVLGTHFNINSYKEEGPIKTTLLEGAVQLISQSETRVLNPGEQGSSMANGSLKVTSQVDLDQVMAWKNGLFNFNNTDLQMVMRQLSRWYGVDVVYEGNPPLREFGGEIQRNLKLSQVLKLLETNEVHFRIEENKLIVTP
ncbi:FecR family protein [Flavihumibacter sp. UBA7668]|uniref:FecR family protein n=1 Tax=Flavihumibacter sp. UBA7668 TaxID=1946542 RepID=UPI0025C58AEA|nr:FecR family protein [Flavihumibacter sp. UBA7668]